MADYSIINGIRVYNSTIELKFGRMTSIGPRMFTDNAKVVCQCECGEVKAVGHYDFAHGRILSCGCWRKEASANRTRTHGMSKTHAHGCWRAMIQRCTNPKTIHYETYGGRGIRVFCDWVGHSGFATWLDHIGHPPSNKHTQDRIDVNGHYEPGNVRWATPKEQRANVRDIPRGKILVAFGISKTITEWSKSSGIQRSAIVDRLKRGWTPEDAVSRRSAATSYRNEDWD